MMGIKKSKNKKKKLVKLVAGLDPGKDGALVLLKKGQIFKMFVVPKLEGNRKTSEPDWHKFDDIFKEYKDRIEHVFLEKPNTGGAFAGRTQSLKLGESLGIFKTMLIANELRFTMLAPTSWQKVMFQGVSVIEHAKAESKEEKEKRTKGKKKKPAPKVKDNKAMALEASKRLFPKVSFVPEGSRKPHDGLVDAALIALYGHWQINGENKNV